MSGDSWVLKAIEAEADRRAAERILQNPNSIITIFGMTVAQVAHLRQEWLKSGKKLEDIPA